ncbi:MAG: class I SAM-dependent methyltransferase, partial [Fimbriimonadaceae bacterium]
MGVDVGPQLVAERTEKARLVRDVFNRIAPVYDRGNAILSLGLEQRWRAAAVARTELDPGDCALDLCCGTGAFLPLLRKSVGPAGRVVGLDVCLPMLQRVGERVSHSQLVLADACRIPVASGSFDAVTVGWGLRNVPDLQSCLSEAVRSLRPGGTLVSLDMAHSQ